MSIEKISEKVKYVELQLNYVCYDTTLSEKLFSVWAALHLLRDEVERNKWIDIDDRSNPMPNDEDFLIKTETGTILRYGEELPYELITHWKRI